MRGGEFTLSVTRKPHLSPLPRACDISGSTVTDASFSVSLATPCDRNTSNDEQRNNEARAQRSAEE